MNTRDILQNPDPAVRLVALRRLADEADDDDVDALVACLQDTDAEVRNAAATALRDWESPQVAAALCTLLGDPATHAAAADSLAQIKNSSSGAVVLPWTHHADPLVARAALRAVRELRLPGALQPALQALERPDADVRLEGVVTLGWLRAEDTVPHLTRLLTEDPDARVRAAAAGAVGMSADESVRTALLQALADPAWFVREAAAATLGKGRHAGPPAVVSALADALEDTWWQVALQAARALGRLRARTAVPALVLLLQHPVSHLRKEAAIALGEVGDEAAVPALLAALQDDDPDVRKLARLALRTLHHDPDPH